MLDRAKFVEQVIRSVHDSSVEGEISLLKAPPGRAPGKKLLRRSAWYKGLSDVDRMVVDEIIESAVHAAIFGLLCVLDGVTGVEERGSPGDFVLTYTKKGRTVHLNSPDEEKLHDAYQSIVQDRVLR